MEWSVRRLERALALCVLLPLLLLLLLHSSSALPLCTNQEAPTAVGALQFCAQYSGTGCCSSDADAAIASQFQAMNISDAACGAYVKPILCAKCDPFSADLFGGAEQRPVPLLCNSTSYCSDLWDACHGVYMHSSPFSPDFSSGISAKASIINQTLDQQWQSSKVFCSSLGSSGAENDICFGGDAYKFPSPSKDVPPAGLCLDKLSNEGYIDLVPHPDGSNRVFLATQQGQVYLATLPEPGSNKPLTVDKTAPFIDISNFIVFDREFGLMSIAFHPDFTSNGRFFLSYNCDKQKWADCGRRCTCEAEVGCDPSQVQEGDGTLPCQFSSVISEFVAGNATVPPSQAVTASSVEVRRILTLGLPYTTHHGGLLLFGPQDKYLYFMMGDGGSEGDPFNFAQNKKSLLGKVLRLDVDKAPTDQEVSSLGLWGHYAVPEDNPFVKDNGSRPEVWAYGLRNPWRCSFDAVKPEYLYCADPGQEAYEEVDLITKGGNYGWRVYEGTDKFVPTESLAGSTNASSIQPIFPIAGYRHNAVNKQQGSASVTGGYVSRSVEDPCLYGRYLYADLYGANIWAIAESPEGSGNYTGSDATVDFTCSSTSPIPCTLVRGTHLPDVGFVFAWGEDNSRNVYMLATKGLYKVVSPSNCQYACSKKLPASATVPALTPLPSPPSPRASGSELRAPSLLAVTVLLLLLGER